jgi:serine/threonine protein phosphatase PrpC
MEDAAGAAEWGAAACYVVADGHGGAEAAEVVVDLLPRLVGEEILAPPPSLPTLEDEIARAAADYGGLEVQAAIYRAFIRCDEACRPAKGGACVVCALLLGDDLYVASAGDCRAILDRDGDETWTWSRACPASPDATYAQGPFAGGVVALSQDHRPDGADGGRPFRTESARVTAVGGRVFALPGETEPRVAARSGKGGLRVTRALGHSLGKEDRSDIMLPRVESSYPGVIPDPDIVGPVRLSGRDATLTLVTDGVSDRLSDDAVARILRDTCPEPHLGPKALLVAALDAGADDNVCALVVYLNRHP